MYIKIHMFKMISDNYNKIVFFSILSSFSSYIYCYFQKKNVIHIYYKPGYIAWMILTCMFFAKKLYNIKR